MAATTNPFHYGGIVGEGDFCNRERELRELHRAVENLERLFVYAERRTGKTSLIRRLLDRLRQEEWITIYVDLWPTDGAAGFIETMAAATAAAAERRSDRLLTMARELFSHLSPSLTLDATGTPILKFGLLPGSPKQPQLDEVLSAPQRIAERTGRRVVVVLDEFQQMMSYADDQVERSLRSSVQEQRGVAWLFLGSRKHLIQQMFLDAERPLYRAAGHYPLSMIATEHWLPFISTRFREGERGIGEEIIAALCDQTQGHPFYTQHLAHALWELTPRGEEATAARLAEALALLLERESYAYSTLWETLTRNQQRLLKALANEPAGAAIFSADVIRRYGLGAPSNAQRAAESLLGRDIIDREGRSYMIVDRFLRLWIVGGMG